MKISPDTSRFTFKYLGLPNGIGGRGGVQRFFMLTHHIPFEEKLVPFNEEWAAEKESLLESGENPCGTVPVTHVDNSKVPLIQHIATCRFLARTHGITSGNYNDYVQDLVADEYQAFRDQWVHMTFTASEEEKKAYHETGLPQQLTKFNALYEKYKAHETFLSVSNGAGAQRPLWGDAAMFGLIRDHILTGHMTLDDLKVHTLLFAMYEKYESIAEVNAWIESHNEPQDEKKETA